MLIFFVTTQITKNKKILILILILSDLLILSRNIPEMMKYGTDLILAFKRLDILLYGIVTIFLLYGISEMLNLLGFNKNFKKRYKQLKTKNKKYLALFFSGFITNIDFSSTELVEENENLFYSSSFLTSTLNPISLISINLLIFLVFLLPETVNVSEYFILIIIGNFFAIIWIVKKAIDISLDKEVENQIYEEKIIKVETLEREEEYLKSINKNQFKNIMLIAIINLVAGSVISIVINSNFNILEALCIFSLLAFLELFFYLEYLIYKNHQFDELELYKKIANGYTSMIGDFIELFLAIILLQINLLLYPFYINIFIKFNIIILLVILVTSIIFTYITESYYISLAFFLPLTSLYLNNEIFPILLIINSIYFINFLKIVKITNKNSRELIKIGITAFIGYIVLFTTGSLVISYVTLGIVVVSYYIIFRKKSLKEKNVKN